MEQRRPIVACHLYVGDNYEWETPEETLAFLADVFAEHGFEVTRHRAGVSARKGGVQLVFRASTEVLP